MQQLPFSPTPGQGLSQPGYPPYSAQPNGGYSSPPSQPKFTRKIALKYGLIFGAIMVVIDLLSYALSLIFRPLYLYLGQQFHFSIPMGSSIIYYSLLPTVIFTLIYWGVYFCAGIFVARQAQQIGAAVTLVCLWASLCRFAIYCLLTVVGVLSSLSLQRSASFWTAYLTSIAIGFAILLFIQIGLGCGIGILGGLVRKNRVRGSQVP